MLELSDILAARERIQAHIVRTPLLRVAALDDILGCRVYLKPENLQHTGSFKLRGASNRLLAMSEAERRQGVVTASSGNHAQAVACASAMLGIDAAIFVPVNCNPAKLAGMRKYGAQVYFAGLVSSEREAKAEELAAAEGRIIVHPFADEYVKAGQGTIGLEMLEDQPELDAVVAPIGGGGLISGIATAVKGLKPGIRVFGVEPASAARYGRSREAGRPLTLDKADIDTIADGTRNDRANVGNFAVIERRVDALLTAGDDAIRAAMRAAAAYAKLIIEPSSAMALAGALSGGLPVNREDKVCFVISGGNNDLSLLAAILA